MKKVLIALLSLFPIVSFSQCMLYEVPLGERVNNATLIVEGEVISSQAERREDNNIYTVHTIELYRVFKGDTDAKTIRISTKGGVFMDAMHVFTPSLQLNTGLFGLFFLEEESVGSENFKPYAGPQGFISYDLLSNSGNDPLAHYADLTTDVDRKIISQTGDSPQVLKKRKVLKNVNSKSSSVGPITSFSPASITAGTKSVLTITGSNFGVSRGTGRVTFENASSGPATINPLSSEYVSWKDDEIKVQVPSAAGTGIFRVVKNGTFSSSDPLKIDYAQLNVTTNNGFAYKVAHVNDNNKGGYDWRFSNDFASNSNARNSFIRALDEWRDATCVNWEIIENTPANTTTNDGTNIIRFANNNELPNGVLAVTGSYYGSCSGGTVWYISEIDMTYSTDVNWNFDQGSPKNNEYDIESVTVHELGHAHSLGHVIDQNDIMHFSIGPGDTKRKLTFTNVAAGNYVQAQSLNNNTCGPSAMTNYPGCISTIGINDNNIGDIDLEIYPNPSKATVYLKVEKVNNADAAFVLQDIRGKIIRRGRITSGVNSIERNELPSGIYFLQVTDGEKLSFSKLILE